MSSDERVAATVQRSSNCRPWPVGRSDNLGYTWCWECDPTSEGDTLVIWSDTVEATDVCELCHQRLDRLACA